MKKAKTIQEIADKYFDRWNPNIHRDPFTAYTIKAERARVRRIVRKVKAAAEAERCTNADELNIQLGRYYACDDILAKLKEER